MNIFEPLNLSKVLKKLGVRKLAGLVGDAQLEAIDEIYNKSITETNLVKILLNRYGSQVFSNKKVRIATFSMLPSSYQAYILDGEYLPERELDETSLRKLFNSNWGRQQQSSARLLEAFDLPLEYLPPEVMPVDSEFTVTPEVMLHPYQRRVKDSLTRDLVAGIPRVLVHMPTGAGKTRTSIEALVDYWRTCSDRSGVILWLAHSEELCEQAVETFTKMWSVRGDSPMDIFRLWGKQPTPDLNSISGFVVASFQRVHAMLSSNDNQAFISVNQLKNKCNTIVIDEAHKAIAPTYKQCIEYISNSSTKIIGLTATPGRETESVNVLEDSETKELVKFFNSHRISLTYENGEEIEDPIAYLQDNDFLSKINRREIKTNVNIDLTEKEQERLAELLEIPASVLKRLAGNSERNTLILNEVTQLARKDESCIVFALSVQHAHLLVELLLINGVQAKCIDGTTSEYDRTKSIEDYKRGEIKVLLNYGVLTTGFDAPITKAVVIARPTTSLVLYSQMVGRGIRGPKMGGNKECLLVDLKDNINGFPDERNAFTYFNKLWEKK
jgi:DNA repair protein RadD